MKQRPYILSIAGFDPSGGAGLTADLKTFEQLKCYGVAACTANTVQDDTCFSACYWSPVAVIIDQLTKLLTRFPIRFVKIGVVENWQVLLEIVRFLHRQKPGIRIILDPVLRSSSDFQFHHSVAAPLDELLPQLYLITPNLLEMEKLYPDRDVAETATHLAARTNLLLKGGHDPALTGRDVLYCPDGSRFTLQPKRRDCTEKHGSGCVLSSAITGYLAKGYPLLKAVYRGKRYTEKFLASTPGLLGYHA